MQGLQVHKQELLVNALQLLVNTGIAGPYTGLAGQCTVDQYIITNSRHTGTTGQTCSARELSDDVL